MSVTVGHLLAFAIGWLVAFVLGWRDAVRAERRRRQQTQPDVGIWIDEREEYDRRLAEMRAGHRRGLARMRQEHDTEEEW